MRVFNALNGDELRQVLLRDVQRVLSQDQELQRHLTFPKVSWRVTIDLKIYPRTPEDKKVEVEGFVEQVIPVPEQPDNVAAAQPVETAEKPLSETLTSDPSPEVGEHLPPDALREEMGISTKTAPPQITFARRGEVGAGAKNPLPVPFGNRVR